MGKRVGIKKETLVRASYINITAKDPKNVKKITEEIVFDNLIVEKCGSSNEIYANDFPSVHIIQSELKSLSDNEMISDVVINVAQKMMAKRHRWLNYVFQTFPIVTFCSNSSRWCRTLGSN